MSMECLRERKNTIIGDIRKVSMSQLTYDMSNNHRKALEEFERVRVWSDVHSKGAAQ